MRQLAHGERAVNKKLYGIECGGTRPVGMKGIEEDLWKRERE